MSYNVSEDAGLLFFFLLNDNGNGILSLLFDGRVALSRGSLLIAAGDEHVLFAMDGKGRACLQFPVIHYHRETMF